MAQNLAELCTLGDSNWHLNCIRKHGQLPSLGKKSAERFLLASRARPGRVHSSKTQPARNSPGKTASPTTQVKPTSNGHCQPLRRCTDGHAWSAAYSHKVIPACLSSNRCYTSQSTMQTHSSFKYLLQIMSMSQLCGRLTVNELFRIGSPHNDAEVLTSWLTNSTARDEVELLYPADDLLSLLENLQSLN